jgi:hypothetical protein
LISFELLPEQTTQAWFPRPQTHRTITMPDNFAKEFDAICTAIESPFPDRVGLPKVHACGSAVTNMSRDTPTRLSFVLYHMNGDHDYDDELSLDDEFQMDGDLESAFTEAVTQATKRLGKPLGDYPAQSSTLVYANRDDDPREGTVIDDVAWTPEYDTGAVLQTDSMEETRYWVFGNRYVILQQRKWVGDGNFDHVVLVTITPAVGEPCLTPQDAHPDLLDAYITLHEGRWAFMRNQVELMDPTQIGRLNVLEKGATTLPQRILEATMLGKLDISNASLQQMNLPLASLPRLTHLALDGNRRGYGGQPAALCVQQLLAQRLPQVSHLCIRGFGNRDSVPAQGLSLDDLMVIADWRGLKELDLCQNNLDFTPDSLHRFINVLRGLHLDLLDVWEGNPCLKDSNLSTGYPGLCALDALQQALSGTRIV